MSGSSPVSLPQGDRHLTRPFKAETYAKCGEGRCQRPPAYTKTSVSVNGKVSPMTDDESLYAFVTRREQELTHQLSALQSQLQLVRSHIAQKEDELAEVRRIRSARLAIAQGKASPDEPTLHVVINRQFKNLGPERYAQMTIKELVVQALIDHFPEGATLAGIRDFIRDAYARTIQSSSLRPQMHRLKASNVLVQDDSSDLWNLRPEKRFEYALFDHPTSRADMKELQDDVMEELTEESSDEEIAKFLEARGLGGGQVSIQAMRKQLHKRKPLYTAESSKKMEDLK